MSDRDILADSPAPASDLTGALSAILNSFTGGGLPGSGGTHPLYSGSLAPDMRLQMDAGGVQGKNIVIQAQSINITTTGTTTMNSSREVKVEGAKTGATGTSTDTTAQKPVRMFDDNNMAGVREALTSIAKQSQQRARDAAPYADPYSDSRSALGAEFLKGFIGKSDWDKWGMDSVMKGGKASDNYSLFDLLIKKPPVDMFGGLDVTQGLDLVQSMVGHGFTQGGRAMRGGRPPEGVNANEFRQRQAAEQMKYFSEVAAAVHTGTAVFKTQNVDEVLYGMSRLGIGGREGITHADPAKMRSRMHQLLAVADEFQEDPSNIVESLLQTQTAMMAASGAAVDPFTGRRHEADTFDRGLDLERLARQIGRDTGKVDSVSVGETVRTLAQLEAGYAVSATGQEYDAALFQLQTGQIDQSVFDNYTRILESGDVRAANNYFRDNIGMGADPAGVAAMAQASVPRRTEEQTSARARTYHRAAAGQAALAAGEGAAGTVARGLSDMRQDIGMYSEVLGDSKLRHAAEFEAGLAALGDQAPEGLREIYDKYGIESARKILSPEQLGKFNRGSKLGLIEAQQKELFDQFFSDEIVGLDKLKETEAQRVFNQSYDKLDPAAKLHADRLAAQKLEGLKTKFYSNRDLLEQSKAMEGASKEELTAMWTKAKEGDLDPRLEAQFRETANRMGVSLPGMATADQAARTDPGFIDTARVEALEKAKITTDARTYFGLEFMDDESVKSMIWFGRGVAQWGVDALAGASGSWDAASRAAEFQDSAAAKFIAGEKGSTPEEREKRRKEVIKQGVKVTEAYNKLPKDKDGNVAKYGHEDTKEVITALLDSNLISDMDRAYLEGIASSGVMTDEVRTQISDISKRAFSNTIAAAEGVQPVVPKPASDTGEGGVSDTIKDSTELIKEIGSLLSQSVEKALQEIGNAVSKGLENTSWKLDFSGTTMKLVDVNGVTIGTLEPDGSGTMSPKG